jgi:RND family efflux transporter MFP subunit
VPTSSTDSTSKMKSAKSALDSARANLTKLQTQVDSNDVKSAQLQLQTAQNNLAKLLNGRDAATLKISETGVSQAELSLKQAQRALDKAKITAPFDGVVAQVNINPGQSAASATASTTGTVSSGDIQLVDLDHLQIVVNLSEVDSPRVMEGQTAQLTFDALPDVNLEGKVVQIWPAGVQSSGVVNYPVTVELANTPASVKPGMSTNLNIVVDERDNVMTVPNRAVKTQGKQKYVLVLFEGQQIRTPVETGLSNDTVTEISSGLKEGDTVILSTTTTSTSNRGIGGIGGPGMGGPPPGM